MNILDYCKPIKQSSGYGDRIYENICTGEISPWLKDGKELEHWLVDPKNLQAFDPGI